MPEKEYVWLPREDILTFEEIAAVVDVFLDLGIDRVRLTGGEPLLRHDVSRLTAQLAAKPRIRDLAMTTNAVLLGQHAVALKEAGLHRVTISLDTLRRDRFVRLTRLDALDTVLAGIEVAREAGFPPPKIDTVVRRGVNDDEIADLLAFARDLRAEIRFIEYMDVGGATRWRPEAVVSRLEILERVAAHFGPARPLVDRSPAPADRYSLGDGTVFGVISSTTQPFCDDCDRSRLTADGVWLLCLYATDGVNLRVPLRRGVPATELRALITRRWEARTDRGAMDRLDLDRRAAVISPAVLKEDAHLEMHTRGG
jgi:cyclic pyranopterin phosphate synthase